MRSTISDSALLEAPLPSTGGTLPPPPFEPPDDGDRWGDDPFYRFSKLLKLLEAHLQQFPGISGVTSGRVRHENKARLGIVVCTSDRSEEELKVIRRESLDFLESYRAGDFPLAIFNQDTIQTAIEYEEAREVRERELSLFSKDPFFSEHVIALHCMKHPLGRVWLIVEDDLSQGMKEEVETRAKLHFSTPVAIWSRTYFESASGKKLPNTR